MARRPVSLLVGLVLAALLLGGVLTRSFGSSLASVVHAQPPTPTVAAERPYRHPLPPELEFLRTMTPAERFDHTLTAQITFRNPQGQNVVLNLIFGKVASVGTSTITITPNGTMQTRTFNVTATTWIVTRPHRGTLATFQPGDRVIVAFVGSSTDAAAIIEPALAGRMMDGVMP